MKLCRNIFYAYFFMLIFIFSVIFFQFFRFIDLLTIPHNSNFYIKLIVSCLNYSYDDGLTRIILQQALTNTNEVNKIFSFFLFRKYLS